MIRPRDASPFFEWASSCARRATRSCGDEREREQVHAGRDQICRSPGRGQSRLQRVGAHELVREALAETPTRGGIRAFEAALRLPDLGCDDVPRAVLAPGHVPDLDRDRRPTFRAGPGRHERRARSAGEPGDRLRCEPVERLDRLGQVLALRVLELRVRETPQALDEDHHGRDPGTRDLGGVVQRA